MTGALVLIHFVSFGTDAFVAAVRINAFVTTISAAILAFVNIFTAIKSRNQSTVALFEFLTFSLASIPTVCNAIFLVTLGTKEHKNEYR